MHFQNKQAYGTSPLDEKNSTFEIKQLDQYQNIENNLSGRGGAGGEKISKLNSNNNIYIASISGGSAITQTKNNNLQFSYSPQSSNLFQQQFSAEINQTPNQQTIHTFTQNMNIKQQDTLIPPTKRVVLGRSGMPKSSKMLFINKGIGSLENGIQSNYQSPIVQNEIIVGGNKTSFFMRSTTDVKPKFEENNINQEEPSMTDRGKRMNQQIQKQKAQPRISGTSYNDLIGNNSFIKHQYSVVNNGTKGYQYQHSQGEILNIFKNAGSQAISITISPTKNSGTQQEIQRESSNSSLKKKGHIFSINETMMSQAKRRQIRRNQSQGDGIVSQKRSSKYFNEFSIGDLSGKKLDTRKKLERAKSLRITKKILVMDKEMTVDQLKLLMLQDYEIEKRQKKKLVLQETIKKKEMVKDDEEISSDECRENQSFFRVMDLSEKEDHMIKLWKQAFLKSRAGGQVINFFNDLSRKIYLFGVSKNLEEIQQSDKIPIYILTTSSRLKNIWHIITIILLIYTATFMPYRIAYVDATPTLLATIEWVVDALFINDIFITFFTAFEDGNGVYQFRLKNIAISYIKGWFFLDCIACFPFQYITVGDTLYQKLLRLLRLPKLYRSLKIMKILESLHFLENNRKYKKCMNVLKMNSAIVRLVQGMISALILTHLFACFWFISSKMYDHGPDTWVARINIQDDPDANQYLYSLYWSTQTVITVGYGDIPAITPSEMLLSLVWMVFGVGFYSFIIGNFSSIISGNIQVQANIQIKIKSLIDLAKKATIPFALSKKIKRFIENNFQALHNQDEEAQLIKMLPPSLRDEVLSNTYGEIIEKISFFKEIEDSDFQWKIMPLLREVKLEKGDILYWRGDHAEDIYFVMNGQIRMYTQKGYPYKKFLPGNMFGDSDSLLNLPRDGKAIAATHVKLMVLKVDSMFEKSMENQEINFMRMIFSAKRKRMELNKEIMLANMRARFHQNIIQKNKKKVGKEASRQYLSENNDNQIASDLNMLSARSGGSGGKSVANKLVNISRALFKSKDTFNTNDGKISDMISTEGNGFLQVDDKRPQYNRFRKNSFNNLKKLRDFQAKQNSSNNIFSTREYITSTTKVNVKLVKMETEGILIPGTKLLNIYSDADLSSNKSILTINPNLDYEPNSTTRSPEQKVYGKDEEKQLNIELKIPEVPALQIIIPTRAEKLKFPYLQELTHDDEGLKAMHMKPKYQQKIASSMNTSRQMSRKGTNLNSSVMERKDKASNALNYSRVSYLEPRTPTVQLNESNHLNKSNSVLSTLSPDIQKLQHHKSLDGKDFGIFQTDPKSINTLQVPQIMHKNQALQIPKLDINQSPLRQKQQQSSPIRNNSFQIKVFPDTSNLIDDFRNSQSFHKSDSGVESYGKTLNILLPPRNKDTQLRTFQGQNDGMMNIQENNSSFRNSPINQMSVDTQNSQLTFKMKENMPTNSFNARGSNKSLQRPSYQMMINNSFIQPQQTADFPLKQLTASQASSILPSNISQAFASQITMQRFQSLDKIYNGISKANTFDPYQEKPLIRITLPDSEIQTKRQVGQHQSQQNLKQVDSLPQIVSQALKYKKQQVKKDTNSTNHLGTFTEVLSSFKQQKSREQFSNDMSYDDKMKYLDEELLLNQEKETIAEFRDITEHQSTSRSGMRDLIIDKIVDNFKNSKSSERLQFFNAYNDRQQPESARYKKIDSIPSQSSQKSNRNLTPIISISKTGNNREKKLLQLNKKPPKRNQSTNQASNQGKQVEQILPFKFKSKKAMQQRGKSQKGFQSEKNSSKMIDPDRKESSHLGFTNLNSCTSRIIVNQDNIEYLGDREMESLVQFNSDMNHISMNVFETFTLFDLYSQGANSLSQTVQNIWSQKQIVEHRQDNMETKIQQIEKQLDRIKYLQSQIKGNNKAEVGMNYLKPNITSQRKVNKQSEAVKTPLKLSMNLNKIQELRF